MIDLFAENCLLARFFKYNLSFLLEHHVRKEMAELQFLKGHKFESYLYFGY